jgi:hypothetical protein
MVFKATATINQMKPLSTDLWRSGPSWVALSSFRYPRTEFLVMTPQ